MSNNGTNSATEAGGLAGIHLAAVTDWLQGQGVPVVPPLSFELIAGGHSNLTYRFTDAAGSVRVLRRPPLGNVLESAHDMAREHRIISAVAGTAVPVASAVALCTDASVNEAPFYIMDYVDGTVLHDAEAAAPLSTAQRVALSERVIDVLVALHGLSPDAIGLGQLGRKEAYLARQHKRWNKQWAASKTHEVPEMEAVSEQLGRYMPEQLGASVVHGDYRLGNMMIDGGDILAVLDWELCTLGDPLADLGYLLNWWTQPEDENAEAAPTGAGGFLTREAMAERYAKVSGRDLSEINYYRAFSHWRLAAIGQGVYKRYVTGAMGEDHDVDLEAQKEGVQTRAQAALELLNQQ
ncbi:MAG: phosphotransferase family protein [Pseudomonadales bacterium]